MKQRSAMLLLHQAAGENYQFVQEQPALSQVNTKRSTAKSCRLGSAGGEEESLLLWL